MAVCFLAFSSNAHGSFEELPTGARAAGLGNAFTAIADDVYSAYYNPAGLVQVRRPEFSAHYSQLYSGLTDNSSIGRSFVAYAHPLKNESTVALQYLSLSLSSLYSETTFGLSYAKSFRDRWNFGGTLKLLKKSYGSDEFTENAINVETGASLGAPDPLFAENGTSKSAIGMDAGLHYRLSRIYALGFAIINMNNPDMALSSSDNDPVAAIYKVAIARKTKRSAADFEISSRKFTGQEFRVNAGAERWYQSGFGFRGGIGFGQRQYQVTSIGFGYRWENMQIDYGLIYPLSGVKGTFGTHQISLTFRIGKRND